MSEELYELLKTRDAEIAALRQVVDELIYELAAMYSEDTRESAYERAHTVLRQVYNDLGLKNDGRPRT